MNDINELTDIELAVADYVVVGTGSVGSVIAERLSADPRNQVVVLEAGGKDTDRRIRMPVTWTQLFRSPIDWDYLTEPQPELNARRIYCSPLTTTSGPNTQANSGRSTESSSTSSKSSVWKGHANQTRHAQVRCTFHTSAAPIR